MIILVFLISFKVLFLVFPNIVLAAAREGLLLWLNNILPALLPFMIITNMLVEMGFARLLGNILSPVMRKIFRLPGTAGFALITGLTSGYPIGAKAVADLHKKNEVSTYDAQHLLAFCNNAGPLFMLGVVGIGLFGSAATGYVLWVSHVLSALVLGIFLSRKILCKQLSCGPNLGPTDTARFVQNNLPGDEKRVLTQPNNGLGAALGGSVKNAMESITVIGGLVIFFSAVMAVLWEVGLPREGITAGLLAGFIEVTGGVRKISEGGISINNLAFTAFSIAFGGFSIHMQTFHFIEGTGIKAAPYLLCKILHGLLAAATTIILARIFV
ncbi:MAG: hypothetical protein FWC32_09450 [Firmicutes bacterium]|nr:hypothetical protein [Bacillota bacterium]